MCEPVFPCLSQPVCACVYLHTPVCVGCVHVFLCTRVCTVHECVLGGVCFVCASLFVCLCAGVCVHVNGGQYNCDGVLSECLGRCLFSLVREAVKVTPFPLQAACWCLPANTGCVVRSLITAPHTHARTLTLLLQFFSLQSHCLQQPDLVSVCDMEGDVNSEISFLPNGSF